MAEIEAEASSWARTAKDLFAGAAGGVAQVLLGKLILLYRYTSGLPIHERLVIGPCVGWDQARARQPAILRLCETYIKTPALHLLRV